VNSVSRSTCVLALLASLALVACDSNSPSAPNDRPIVIAVFADPDSSFRTSNVIDVDDEVVQFDTANNRLIWIATGQTFDNWTVSGNFLGTTGEFQVRFGVVSGEQRAYFTETGPATICDLSIENGQLVIRPTSAGVPQ